MPIEKKYYENGTLKAIYNYGVYVPKNKRFHHVLENINEDGYILHSDDGKPSFIEYYENGNIKEIGYHDKGEYYRIGQPAEIFYHECGTIKYEIYYEIKGVMCRHEDKPTQISYYESGQIDEELYFEEDEISRYHAPASYFYNEDGTIRSYLYLIDDMVINTEYAEWCIEKFGEIKFNINYVPEEDRVEYKLKWGNYQAYQYI